jgi:hypothetical protein
MSADLPTIYYEMPDGAVLEWQNWNTRHPGGRIYGRYLDEDDIAKLRAMRELSFSDREIYVRFHPEVLEPRPPAPPAEQVSLPVEMLDRRQLAWVIERKLGLTMPSLGEMNEQDLIQLFRRLNSRP